MPEALDPLTKEMAALAAAVAGHCQPCFAYHYQEAARLGASLDAVQAVVELARAIRAAGDRHMDEFVARRIAQSRSDASIPKGEPDVRP